MSQSKNAGAPAGWLPARDVLRITKVSARTLARYADQGLITRPVVAPVPKGRGTTNFYEPHVVERVKELAATKERGGKRRVALGLTANNRRDALLELAFRSDDPIHPAWEMSIEMRMGAPPTPMERFVTSIAYRVRNLTSSNELAREVGAVLDRSGAYEQARAKVKAGFLPVLVVRGTEVRILADVELPHRFDLFGDGVLLVPLRQILEAIDDAPLDTRVHPSGGVTVTDEQKRAHDGMLKLGGAHGVEFVLVDPN